MLVVAKLKRPKVIVLMNSMVTFSPITKRKQID
jgi:hypothetical protein